MKLYDLPEWKDIIEERKMINKIFSEARNKSKPKKCILCGKDQTSFCNSHSVPQFSLRAIAENGKLYAASALMGIDAVDIEAGIRNAGTFHFICNECDGKYFQDYENEDNLIHMPTDKMLAEIAVKNILLQLYKRHVEKEVDVILQKKYDLCVNPGEQFAIVELDIRDYLEELEFHKDNIENEKSGGYRILYWSLLPYKVPIAAQSAIALSVDMEGNVINDVFDMSKDTKIQFLHLAIFPLENRSVVLAFCHKRDKLYKKLWHQFNSSSEERNLCFLNYLVFSKTENYFMSKRIEEEIKTNEKLVLLGQENNEFPELGFLNANYRIRM